MGRDDRWRGWLIGQVLASLLQATTFQTAQDEKSNPDEDQDAGCGWISEGSLICLGRLCIILIAPMTSRAIVAP